MFRCRRPWPRCHPVSQLPMAARSLRQRPMPKPKPRRIPSTAPPRRWQSRTRPGRPCSLPRKAAGPRRCRQEYRGQGRQFPAPPMGRQQRQSRPRHLRPTTRGEAGPCHLVLPPCRCPCHPLRLLSTDMAIPACRPARRHPQHRGRKRWRLTRGRARPRCLRQVQRPRWSRWPRLQTAPNRPHRRGARWWHRPIPLRIGNK